jgi:urease accessory protein
MDWMVLQLADSAFPAGGFAHSGGLEAAAQLGELRGEDAVACFVRDAMWQAGHTSLPLVAETCRRPERLPEVDSLCDAFLLGAVANRASRTQGRAMLAACSQSFGGDAFARAHDAARERRLHGHHAPVFGFAAHVLGVSRQDALSVWMHAAARGVLSAAVRLGLLGTHEAQATLRETAPLLTRIVTECGLLHCESVAQTSPWIEIVGSQHERLYSRLFQS